MHTRRVLEQEAAKAEVHKDRLVTQLRAAYAHLQLRTSHMAFLSKFSVESLTHQNATLARRVGACTALLKAFHDLGQEPPEDFLGWPIKRLEVNRRV